MSSALEGAWRRAGAAVVVMGLAVAGCAPPAGSPRVQQQQQQQRQQQLPQQPGETSQIENMTAQPAQTSPGRRVSNLLDFESPQDLAFLLAEPAGAAMIDSRFGHTGTHCLYLAPGVSSLTIKTPALLQGRPFPADWTLLGGYVYVDQPTQLALVYESGGRAVVSRTLAVAPRGWTPIMLDLTSLGGGTQSEVGLLKLQFAQTAQAPGGSIRLDDILLVDNHEVFLVGDAWSLRREGLAYTIDAPGRFSFKLPSAEAQQGGWSVIEASEMRIRFSSTASPSTTTIYSDGRMYWGDRFQSAARSLGDAKEQAAQHTSPAEIAIAASMGRVNRSSAGDADNDGYNETRGSYEIIATGPRIELTVTPRAGTSVSRPVLEIAGMPAGAIRATMEGRLIADTIRLSGGEVLVELPGQIDRATSVNVRVK